MKIAFIGVANLRGHLAAKCYRSCSVRARKQFPKALIPKSVQQRGTIAMNRASWRPHLSSNADTAIIATVHMASSGNLG